MVSLRSTQPTPDLKLYSFNFTLANSQLSFITLIPLVFALLWLVECILFRLVVRGEQVQSLVVVVLGGLVAEKQRFLGRGGQWRLRS